MARIKKHYSKWQVLYRDSRGREKSAGAFSRKSDAERQRRTVEYQRETGEWIDPALKSTLLRDWASRWLATRSHLKPKTVLGYESLLRSRILPRFGDHQLRAIRAIDVEEWIADLVAAGLSPSRIIEAHRVLSMMIDAAVRSQMLNRNPVRGLALPRPVKREQLFLEAEQVGRLARAIDQRFEVWVYLMAYSGVRWGEAAALRRHRVNLLHARMEIVEATSDVAGEVIFGPPKSHRHRTIALPRFLTEKLEHHMASFTAPEAEALVFPAAEGGVLRNSNFRRRIWKPALEKAGLPPALRIHDLRHTAAALLISQGAHPEAMKRHFGHSGIGVTMDTYGHLFPSDADRLAADLDTIYEGVGGRAGRLG